MLTKKLYISFKYAFAGFWFCIKNERNFRVHILAALTVVLLSPYYGFSPEQGVLIAIVIALVLICEMFNTALEAMVDLETTEYNELAKKAKDVSAGAVLVAALCAIACFLFLFLKADIIHNIITDITSSALKSVLATLYLAAGYFFVRWRR